MGQMWRGRGSESMYSLSSKSDVDQSDEVLVFQVAAKDSVAD
jgi:hypothetical protein